MKNKIPFYAKTVFWENIKKTLAVFSGPAVFSLHTIGVDEGWMLAGGIIAGITAVLAIWLVDNNNDGVIDLFQ